MAGGRAGGEEGVVPVGLPLAMSVPHSGRPGLLPRGSCSNSAPHGFPGCPNHVKWGSGGKPVGFFVKPH